MFKSFQRVKLPLFNLAQKVYPFVVFYFSNFFKSQVCSIFFYYLFPIYVYTFTLSVFLMLFLFWVSYTDLWRLIDLIFLIFIWFAMLSLDTIVLFDLIWWAFMLCPLFTFILRIFLPPLTWFLLSALLLFLPIFEKVGRFFFWLEILLIVVKQFRVLLIYFFGAMFGLLVEFCGEGQGKDFCGEMVRA